LTVGKTSTNNDIGDNNDHIFHPFELDLNKLGANPYNDDRTIKTNIFADRSVAPDIQDEDDVPEEAPNAKNQAHLAISNRGKTVIIDDDEETAISPANSKKPTKPHSIHTATTPHQARRQAHSRRPQTVPP
jgi:hypothetical protein